MDRRPPIPESAATLKRFGGEIMRWGTGDASARARIAGLTKEELDTAGVTREIAERWRDFYRNEVVRHPRNPSARGRADLMQRAVGLLDGGN